MANKHLQGKPHPIDEFTWWYEEPEGICVVSTAHEDNGDVNRLIWIPWCALRAAVRRKDRKSTASQSARD